MPNTVPDTVFAFTELWTHVSRPTVTGIFPMTNHVGIRSFDSFIPCAQDRVLFSVPSKIAVIGVDSSDF